MKFLEKIYDGLLNTPVQSTVALVILLLAYPMIRSALREKPPTSAPPPVPIEIESPWFLQNFLQMQADVEKIKDQLAVLSSQISGIAKLLRKRQSRSKK